MGQPVSEVMPSLPDASSIPDKFSSYSYTTEEEDEAGSHHQASYDATVGIADGVHAGPSTRFRAL